MQAELPALPPALLRWRVLDAQDKRLAWFDMDLSTRPYRVMRYHTSALTGVAFHRTYPLFASSSTDASVHVFHGMVYQVRCRFAGWSQHQLAQHCRHTLYELAH